MKMIKKEAKAKAETTKIGVRRCNFSHFVVLPCLAFHFDECQTFLRGYTNQNLPKEGNIDTQLIPLYKFRAFCNSLKHFAYSSNVVFCFTGTRYEFK